MQIASHQPGQTLRTAVLNGRLPEAGTVTIGLMGRGIDASLSPVMHEREGQRLGLDYRYHLIDFDRLGIADARLPDVLAEARELGFAGLNVTYPFKQSVLPLLDALAPDAAAIGAVNTVVFETDRTIGHNTDCWGFAQSFREGLVGVPIGRVLQLGAGGAGAAVSHALLQEGVRRLDLYDTVPGRAHALADRLRELFSAEISVITALPMLTGLSDGIVNTTPLGMAKHPGLPLAAELISHRHWVADVVYFPLETALIAHARALGCRVLPGGGMAVYQAVRAFELFCGIKPDAGAMTQTFRAALAGQGISNNRPLT